MAHRTVGGPRMAHQDGRRPLDGHQDGWRPLDGHQDGGGPWPPGARALGKLDQDQGAAWARAGRGGADRGGWKADFQGFWAISAGNSAEVPGPGRFSGLKEIAGGFWGWENLR